MLRKCPDEDLQHRAQTPRDLDAAGAEMAYLGEGEVHEVLPVGGPENHPEGALLVIDLLAAQMPAADRQQQPVQLVDGEGGRCRVIDRRRQRLVGNIHQDAEGKGRVLLNGPFRPEGDRRPQFTVVNAVGAAIEAKQRLVLRQRNPPPGGRIR